MPTGFAKITRGWGGPAVPSILSLLMLAFLAASAGSYGAEPERDSRPLSPAQLALFETDHLKMIERAQRLDYRFTRETSDTPAGIADRVALDLRPRNDGSKDIFANFLSGERHKSFPPLIGFRGNPLVMYFLERDVEEMRRQTGGAAVYFRNRIRNALVDQAQLRAVEVEREGRTLSATEITLHPFRDDARLGAHPWLQNKRYRFVLSDAVPGSLYEIGSEAPGESGQPARVKETIVFAGEQPCGGTSGPCEAAGQR
jgi:hypothetical protein